MKHFDVYLFYVFRIFSNGTVYNTVLFFLLDKSWRLTVIFTSCLMLITTSIDIQPESKQNENETPGLLCEAKMKIKIFHWSLAACFFRLLSTNFILLTSLNQTVYEALQRGTPVVIIDGSGQWSNILASLHSIQLSEINETVIKAMLEGKSAYSPVCKYVKKFSSAA